MLPNYTTQFFQENSVRSSFCLITCSY